VKPTSADSLLRKITNRIQVTFFPTAHQRVLAKWYSDGGDQELRYRYDLKPDSLVMDLGGYDGQWSSDIFSRYCCNICIFEPVGEFAARIQNRFKKNPRITVLPFGLGAGYKKAEIGVSGTSSSLFRDFTQKVEVEIVDAATWIYAQDIAQIDLMKINIEGGEYELLDRLIETNIVSIIGNLQVQFHQISENSTERMEGIQERLRETHTPTYQYRFVWENWIRRGLRSSVQTSRGT
jgi:FkbM family methyltransferase